MSLQISGVFDKLENSTKGAEKAGSMAQVPLPTELWLQVLEVIGDMEYLWNTIRLVSSRHKAYVERLFSSNYLPKITVSLSLPRHDPSTGALRWPGAIPGAQITLQFVTIEEQGRLMKLISPSSIKDGLNVMSVESLKDNQVLTKQRLDAATVWICMERNRAKGVSIDLPRSMSWDNEKRVWTWDVDWKKFVSTFFAAKRARRNHQQLQATTRKPAHQGNQYRRRR